MRKRLKRRKSFTTNRRKEGRVFDDLPPLARLLRLSPFRRASSQRKSVKRRRPIIVSLKKSNNTSSFYSFSPLSFPSISDMRRVNRSMDKSCPKVERADKARRRNFFRAKNKGGTSVRPEHNRKHKRVC